MITPEQYNMADRPIDQADFPFRAFLKHFDEPLGSRGLELGANEEWLCSILTRLGYRMTGVDARPFRAFSSQMPVDMPTELDWNHYIVAFDDIQFGPIFDFIVSLSAIEHFGLAYYEGDVIDPDADIKAMKWCYDMLKNNGRMYLTVPIGIPRQTQHWRQYSIEEIFERLIGDFVVKTLAFYKWDNAWDAVLSTVDEAVKSDMCLHEILLVLRK